MTARKDGLFICYKSTSMNYIELINRFWTLNREYSFNASETALYFHLLNVANSLHWKNPFREGNIAITAAIGLSEPTIQRSRVRLVQAELIEFRSGQKKRELTQYRLISGRGSGKDSGIHDFCLSDSPFVTQSDSQTGINTDTQAADFIKTIPNETKQNYLNIKGHGTIADLYLFFESHFAMQLANWRQLFPLIDLREACRHFMLERTCETFNDFNHLRNAFARKLRENPSFDRKDKKLVHSKKYSCVQEFVDTTQQLIDEFDEFDQEF
mgnify:CR=1 FL=1